MRAEIRPKTINGKTYTFKTKCPFTIEHNGISYSLGTMTPGSAMKKAHHMVRNYLMNQWRETRRNIETIALVMADGVQVGSVYGFHRDRNINIIHQ